MINRIRSELLKYRHTFIPWMVVGAPVVIPLICAWQAYSRSQGGLQIEAMIDNGLLVWFNLWLPIFCALIAGTIMHMEQWKGLLVRPLSVFHLYMLKGAALLVMMVLTNGLFLVCLLLLSLMPAAVGSAASFWIGSWTGLALFFMPYSLALLLLAAAFGRTVTVIVGVVGIIGATAWRTLTGYGVIDPTGLQLLLTAVLLAGVGLLFWLGGGLWFVRRQRRW
ncbi:ABC transporter permease [Paenibacillus dauci]|uniref:ABC transporter permease n=1 Tax=Paenibacillus dauci TaxID=1567106 RepID=UPI000619BC37|nr:ABC transporter permease [Paenibacillus dauci]